MFKMDVVEKNGENPWQLGKWFVSKEEFIGNEYPPYCSGTAYVTTISSMKLVTCL